MKNPLLILLLTILTCTAALSQVPKFNSHPGASATIYLDFDGQYVTGTSWNWNGPINAAPAQLSIEGITEIFNRVAEDFRIFQVNITTDSAVFRKAPISRKMRVIITPTSSWYGNAGGVAYVGSFTWGNNTPAWVFSNLLNNNIKNIAEACSHEAGHTLGLQHQSQYNSSCSKVAEYYAGQGSGEIGWAPIMGVGYYRNLTTWHNGTNAVGCNVYQNDIDVIAGGANGFGFRLDDHGNDLVSATSVSLAGTSFGMSGVVNNSTDADVFKMTVDYRQNFKLTAIPQNVGSNNSGANVDIKVSLLTAAGDTIGKYNPSMLLNAGIDTNLNQGIYYLVAEGTSNINQSDYGSVGYYSMTGELNVVLPVNKFKLTGSAANGVHALTWSYIANEIIQSFEVEQSDDGNRYEKLASLAGAERSITWKPLSVRKKFYRIRAITPDERSYYSNIIHLSADRTGKPVQVMNSLAGNEVLLNSTGSFHYQILLQNGQVLAKGQLRAGINKIAVRSHLTGLMIVRFTDGNEWWSEKLVLE